MSIQDMIRKKVFGLSGTESNTGLSSEERERPSTEASNQLAIESGGDDIEAMLRNIGFQEEAATTGLENSQGQFPALENLIAGNEEEASASVLSWSGMAASRGMEITDRENLFGREMVEFASQCVARPPGLDSEGARGMSVYGERQIEDSQRTILDVPSSPQDDGDVDVSTQGSRDAKVEFGLSNQERAAGVGLDEESSPEDPTKASAMTEARRRGTDPGMMSEIEDEHVPGSQRAAVDMAVAEALQQKGVVTEEDFVRAAAQEYGLSARMERIKEEADMASGSGEKGESDISDMPEVLRKPDDPPGLPSRTEESSGMRPGIQDPSSPKGRNKMDADISRDMEDEEPSTPVLRTTSKKARVSPEHEASPEPPVPDRRGSGRSYSERDIMRDIVGPSAEDEMSVDSAVLSTPKVEVKRKVSGTPVMEREYVAYAMNTPEARRPARAESSPPSVVHPSVSQHGGYERQPLVDSRICEVESSVAELYGLAKEQEEARKGFAAGLSSLQESVQQELLNIATQVATACAQLEEETLQGKARDIEAGDIRIRCERVEEQSTKADKRVMETTNRVNRVEETMNEISRSTKEAVSQNNAGLDVLTKEISNLGVETRQLSQRVQSVEGKLPARVLAPGEVSDAIQRSVAGVKDACVAFEAEMRAALQKNDADHEALKELIQSVESRLDKTASALEKKHNDDIRAMSLTVRELGERELRRPGGSEQASRSRESKAPAFCAAFCACTGDGEMRGKCVDQAVRDNLVNEKARVNQLLTELTKLSDRQRTQLEEMHKRGQTEMQSVLVELGKSIDENISARDSEVRAKLERMNKKIEDIIKQSKAEGDARSHQIDVLRNRIGEVAGLREGRGDGARQEEAGPKSFYGTDRDRDSDQRKAGERRSVSLGVGARAPEDQQAVKEMMILQGEMKGLIGRLESEENRRQQGEKKLESDFKNLQTEVSKLEGRLKILEREHARSELDVGKTLAEMGRDKEKVEKRWEESERRASALVRRVDALENELERVRGRPGSAERTDGLLARIMAMEEKLAEVAGENAAPAGISEPRSHAPGDFARRGTQASAYTPAPSVAGDGSIIGENIYQQRRFSDAPPKSSSGGLMPEDLRGSETSACEVCRVMMRRSEAVVCSSCGARVCMSCTGQQPDECYKCETARMEMPEPGKGGSQRMPTPRLFKQSGRGYPIGGGGNDGESTSGMNRCEDIKIQKGAPTSHTLLSWISDVANAARTAFLYDPDYAHGAIIHALNMPEADRKRPLHYTALESKLYQALKDTVKRGTPEAARIAAAELNAATDGRPVTALQVLAIIAERVRVPEDEQGAVFMQAILDIHCMTMPGKAEEQCLEEFLSRWDIAVANLRRVKEVSMPERMVTQAFVNKVSHLNCLSFIVSQWDELAEGQRTYAWLRERVDKKIAKWTQKDNSESLRSDQMRAITETGYSALPAPHQGAQTRGRTSTPHRQSYGSQGRGNQRGRSNSTDKTGRGISVPPAIRDIIGTKDDPKNRFGSKSPRGLKKICYPFTRGECPRSSAECQYSHDVYLYDEAAPVLEKEGYCPAFNRYGTCREENCRFLHLRPPQEVLEKIPTKEIPQSTTRAESPHPEAPSPDFA